MKQLKNIFAIAILSLSFCSQLYAADTIPSVEDEPVELKVVGNYLNQPVLSLFFSENALDKEYKVIVKDSYGYEFFNGTVKAKNEAKQFLLSTDELGSSLVTFEITGKTSGKKVTFNVNNQQSVQQQTEVVKL